MSSRPTSRGCHDARLDRDHGDIYSPTPEYADVLVIARATHIARQRRCQSHRRTRFIFDLGSRGHAKTQPLRDRAEQRADLVIYKYNTGSLFMVVTLARRRDLTSFAFLRSAVSSEALSSSTAEFIFIQNAVMKNGTLWVAYQVYRSSRLAQHPVVADRVGQSGVCQQRTARGHGTD